MTKWVLTRHEQQEPLEFAFWDDAWNQLLSELQDRCITAAIQFEDRPLFDALNDAIWTLGLNQEEEGPMTITVDGIEFAIQRNHDNTTRSSK